MRIKKRMECNGRGCLSIHMGWEGGISKMSVKAHF